MFTVTQMTENLGLILSLTERWAHSVPPRSQETLPGCLRHSLTCHSPKPRVFMLYSTLVTNLWQTTQSITAKLNVHFSSQSLVHQGLHMSCVGPPLLSLSETPLQSRLQMSSDCGVYPTGLTEGEPTTDRIQFLVGSCTRDSAYFWLLDIYCHRLLASCPSPPELCALTAGRGSFPKRLNAYSGDSLPYLKSRISHKR